jgi:hypothetical protein
MAPCPGKKAFASSKKAVIPLSPMRTPAVWWFWKKSICSVALQLRRCSLFVRTLHSSDFARFASGAFYETIAPLASASVLEIKKGRTGKFSPGQFCLRRLLFCPGNHEKDRNAT